MIRRRKLDIHRIWKVSLFAAVFFFILLSVIYFVKGNKWDGTRRFTVVADGNPILLFSIEPNTRQATLVIIAPNTILEVPYGYGTYKAAAVYPLGSLDSKRGGGKLLQKSIEETLGVAVEGFFAGRNSLKLSFPQDADKLIDLKKTYFSLSGFFPAVLNYQKAAKNLVTNLSYVDIYRLWNAIRNLRSDQISIINLSENRVVTEEKLPDGTTVGKIDKDLLDLLLSSKFQDQLVRAQNVSVEVVNATDQEKVAYQFSRILQNLGANVVVKSTSDKKESFSCKAFTSRKELLSSIILERLSKQYNCRGESTEGPGMTDIKIILGEEYVK